MNHFNYQEWKILKINVVKNLDTTQSVKKWYITQRETGGWKRSKKTEKKEGEKRAVENKGG